MSGKDEKGFFDLNGHRYKVFFEDLDKFKDDDVGDRDILYGMSNHSVLAVAVNNSTAKSKQEETLIHEVLHCIFASTGFKHDEKLIMAISGGLNQLGVGKHLVRNIKKAGKSQK